MLLIIRHSFLDECACFCFSRSAGRARETRSRMTFKAISSSDELDEGDIFLLGNLATVC